ncbi:DUF917 family protein [uncultured Leifsonia sp.]|uniref:S-methyl thiohydantoin desulfurase domain-containing protein n=1 Tax=uncultured Leifsonia sp. TaxID=340359 RepID=UPI0028D3D50C|nr:DUF917 family protein [uncultured Leifsonia sp.]
MDILGRERLAALGRGFELLGSGGGGGTTMMELMVADAPVWPLTVHAATDLDPGTPCVAAAFAGSTYLLAERIPAADVFDPLVEAAERWTGVGAAAVCALEGAGLNGLTPLLLAGAHALVDADFMGRALPRLDQLSLLVDAVPGVIAVCDTGRGVAVVDSQRPADVEALVRSSIVQAGGAGAVLVAGFTVGDLLEHAVLGTYSRALALGAAAEDDALPLDALAAALGGRLLGAGRVTAIDPAPGDPFASAVELAGDDGAVLRIVARSELLAFARDGETVAASPEIIVALDTISRDILQADAITLARHVAVVALPAPGWWLADPARVRHVTPSAFGLAGLEVQA